LESVREDKPTILAKKDPTAFPAFALLSDIVWDMLLGKSVLPLCNVLLVCIASVAILLMVLAFLFQRLEFAPLTLIAVMDMSAIILINLCAPALNNALPFKPRALVNIAEPITSSALDLTGASINIVPRVQETCARLPANAPSLRHVLAQGDQATVESDLVSGLVFKVQLML